MDDRDELTRPRLTARADAVLSSRVTLIVAPPGSGKSVLLRQWASHLEGTADVAVTQLTAEDNDPEYFRWRVGMAVASLVPGLQWEQRAPISPADLEHFIRSVLIRPTAGRPFVLAFDGLDLVLDSEVLSVFAEALSAFPESIRLLVVSRRAFPLPLAELRVQGAVHEVGPAELAFTAEELDALAEQRGVPLSSQARQELLVRTGGWACAVSLLLARGDQTPDARERSLQGYLDEAMLADLPPQVRRFVQETAVLENPIAALADRLLGSDTAASHYAVIDRLGRFPVVDASGDRWQPPVVRAHRLARLTAVDPGRAAELRDAAAALQAELLALSSQERELLALLGQGQTAAGAARHLSISFHEVRELMRSLYAKLAAPERDGALQRGRELGLLAG